MRSSAPRAQLADVLELVIDHRGKTPKKLGGDFVDTGVPVLSAKHVKTDRLINFDELRFVSDDMYCRWMKVELQPGDIILTSEAPLGEVYVMEPQSKYVLGQRLFALRPKAGVSHPQYLAAWLASPEGQKALHDRATGTTAQGIKQSELLKVEIPLPAYEEQCFIGNLRASLTGKIALNAQIVRTCESIAETLFKSWFIDFEPVKAKIEGREPVGMDAETAALFPDRLVGSGAGWIPSGWAQATLGDLCELAYGKALRKADRNPGASPVYGSGGITGFHDRALVQGPGVIIGRKGTVGSVYWEERDFFPIDTVFYIKPRDDTPIRFLHQLCRYLPLQEMNTDAAVPGLNRSNVYRLDVVVPPSSLLLKYEGVVSSLYDSFFVRKTESEGWADLRDTLLPRLISRELKLPEAEDYVEAATA